jgi:hypothetical protein
MIGRIGIAVVALLGLFGGSAAAAGSGTHVKEPMASSFADPADIAAFKRCKAQGHTDKQCFAIGDNGIGYWGDVTASDTPMCALPPGEWKKFGSKARGKKMKVTYRDKTVICELRDTLPPVPKHNVVIDLNPGALKALGLTPGGLYEGVHWKWLD